MIELSDLLWEISLVYHFDVYFLDASWWNILKMFRVCGIKAEVIAQLLLDQAVKPRHKPLSLSMLVWC